MIARCFISHAVIGLARDFWEMFTVRFGAGDHI